MGTSMQIKGFRKRSEAVLGEVEDFLASHLRRVPMLAPYADKPYSTRLVYLLVAAPLLALAMPLLLLGGTEPQQRWNYLAALAVCTHAIQLKSDASWRRPRLCMGFCRSGPGDQGGVVAEQRCLGERAQQGAAAHSQGGSGQEEGQGEAVTNMAWLGLLVARCQPVSPDHRGGGSRSAKTPSACQSSTVYAATHLWLVLWLHAL